MLINYINKIKRNQIEFLKLNTFLLFFWPFIAFINSLKRFSSPSSKLVLLLFFCIYGYTYYLSKGSTSDAIWYAQSFIDMSGAPYSEFNNILNKYNDEEGTTVDLFIPLVNFILSRFTSNYHWLFAVYALFFGYYYVQSIGLLHKIYLCRVDYYSLLLLFLFISTIPIHRINGIRFWLASWVFFYSAYHVVLYRRYQFIILSVLSSFIHFSFLSVNLILVVYIFLGLRNILYYQFLIVSFILPKYIHNNIGYLSEYFHSGISTKFSIYSKLIDGESLPQTNIISILVGYSNDIIHWYLIASVFFVSIKVSRINLSLPHGRLYSFLILFLSCVNFIAEIPSGERFYIVFYLFAILYLLFIYTSYVGLHLNILLYIGVPIFLFNFIFEFRLLTESLNLILFLPITVLLQNGEVNYQAFKLYSKIFH